MGLADPIIDRFETSLRGRIRRFLIVTLVAVGVEVGLFAWLFLSFESVPWWILPYAGATSGVAIGVALWTMRRTSNRIGAFLRIVRPRLRDAGFSGGSNVLVFDTGLVTTLGPALVHSLYASPAGSPAIPQDVPEAVRFSRGSWRLRTVGTVSGTKGPEGARTRLADLQRRLGWSRAMAMLRERRIGATPDPHSPPWIAILVLSDAKCLEKGDQWVAELDNVRDFLERLRKEYFPPSAI